jgi:hypothetical protein
MVRLYRRPLLLLAVASVTMAVSVNAGQEPEPIAIAAR